MTCEYCRTEMEMFDRICSNCGREVEYASRKIESGIIHYSPVETQVEKKILTKFRVNKNKAGTGVRFLYTDFEFEKIKQNLGI